MREISETCCRVTLKDSLNAISSPGSVDGPMPCGSLGGLTIKLSGPVPARANLSALEESSKELMMIGTYGQSGENLSPSATLQSSLENKLLARLQRYGSPECDLSWNISVIDSGPPVFVVRASLRLTTDPVIFLWPTPQARDHFPAHKPEYIAEKRAQGHGMSNLNDCVSLLLWPTPTAITNSGGAALCKWSGTRSRELLRGAVGNTVLNGALNPAFPLWLMGYPIEWELCAEQVTPSSRRSRKRS